MSFRAVTHIALHVLVPGLIAWTCFRRRFWKAWAIMVAANLIDVDHLLATPIYNPNRCSIGFHPLHQYPVIPLYGILALWPRTRLIGLGALIHVILDGIDCWGMRF